MTEPIFDRQKLDRYRLSIEYVAAPCGIAQRIVSLPTRSIQRTDHVAPDAIEYEYEYRSAEYE